MKKVNPNATPTSNQNITTINQYAFQKCTSLKKANIGTVSIINKAAFDKMSEYPYADDFVGENGEPYSEGQSIGTWGFSDENGTIVELEMYWPTKEYFNIFKSEVESLKTPVTVNTIVLQEVSKAFDKYANGNGNLDEVVKSIGDNIDLILAE